MSRILDSLSAMTASGLMGRTTTKPIRVPLVQLAALRDLFPSARSDAERVRMAIAIGADAVKQETQA